MPVKVQEAYRTTTRLGQKRKYPHHIIIKTLNIQNKERIILASREKDQVTYRGRTILVNSVENLKAKRAQRDVMKTLREHRCHPK